MHGKVDLAMWMYSCLLTWVALTIMFSKLLLVIRITVIVVKDITQIFIQKMLGLEMGCSTCKVKKRGFVWRGLFFSLQFFQVFVEFDEYSY